MASIFEYQNRETRALGEKLASSDLEKTLIASLADGTVCAYLLTNQSGSNSATFNPTGLSSTSPATVQIPNPPSAGGTIYASVNTTTTPPTPGVIVAQVGQPASGYSNTLFVQTIQLQVQSCSSPSSIPGPITCAAQWQLGFDNTKTVRTLRPDSISVTLNANQTSATSATVTGCQSASPSSPFRYEGAQNVSGSTCATGLVAGAFCNNAFLKHITFAKPFASIPQVIVTPRIESIFTYCPCCSGAYDQAIASPINITTNGFDAENTISPWGNDCAPYENLSTQMAFDWIAIGN